MNEWMAPEGGRKDGFSHSPPSFIQLAACSMLVLSFSSPPLHFPLPIERLWNQLAARGHVGSTLYGVKGAFPFPLAATIHHHTPTQAIFFLDGTSCGLWCICINTDARSPLGFGWGVCVLPVFC